MPNRIRPTVVQLRAGLAFVEGELRRVVATDVAGLPRQWARGHMARTADGLRGIQALSTLDLPHECGALARIACEAGLQLAWILQTRHNDNPEHVVAERTQELLDAAQLAAEVTVRGWAVRGLTSQAYATEFATRAREIRQRRAAGGRPTDPDANVYNHAGSAGLGEAYDLYYRTLCDSAHPSVWASAAALQPPSEETHSRTLFIALSMSLLVLDCGLQLLQRGKEYEPIPKAVSAILGVDITAQPRVT